MRNNPLTWINIVLFIILVTIFLSKDVEASVKQITNEFSPKVTLLECSGKDVILRSYEFDRSASLGIPDEKYKGRLVGSKKNKSGSQITIIFYEYYTDNKVELTFRGKDITLYKDKKLYTCDIISRM